MHRSNTGFNWLCFKNYTWAHWSIHYATFLVWENIERLVWENIDRSCGSEILILSSYYTHFQNKLGHYI